MEMTRVKFKDLTAPLQRARDWLRDQASAGEAAECPCCGRAVGYELRLEHVHASELLRFAQAAREQADRYGGEVVDQGIHVPTVLGGTAESYSQNCLSQLRHFGLVKQSGAKAGWWKLTEKGAEFLLGTVNVERAAWLFKSELLKYVDAAGTVGIHDLVPADEYHERMGDAA